MDVEQTQKGQEVAVFALPFEVTVCIDGKQTTHRREMAERHGSIVVETSRRPDWVSIDPNYRICAPLTFSAPADMLRKLLTDGPKARARRMAAMALGKRQDPKTVQALSDCLHSEDELWMVRAKAAESLSKIQGQEAEASLLSGVEIEHPKVRRAVADALGSVLTKEAADALLKLSKDRSYLVTAAAARSLGKSRDDRNVSTLKALLRKSSWSEVVRSGALWALSRTGDEDVLSTLMEWTNYGKPLRARRTAIAVLPHIGEGKKVRQHLEDMLRDRDPHIRSAVLSALSTLGDAKAKGAINELLEKELDGGVKTRAREVLASLGKEARAGIREIREDNQKLRRELSEMKTRLSKLEQLSSDKRKTSAKEPEPPPSTSSKNAPTKNTPKRTATKKATAKKATAKKATAKKATAKKRPPSGTSSKKTSKRGAKKTGKKR